MVVKLCSVLGRGATEKVMEEKEPESEEVAVKKGITGPSQN